MNIIKLNGFIISSSGTARQLIVLTHGGWKPIKGVKSALIGKQSGDGMTTTPAGVVTHFYTEDGDFTLGNSVFAEVMKRPAEAFNGLEKDPGITLAQGTEYHGGDAAKGQKMVDDALMFALSRIQTVPGSFEINNYALYTDDRPQATSNFDSHQAGNYTDDIDLAVIDTAVQSKRHLSELYSFATACGQNYQRIHAGFCRVAR